MNTPEEDVEHHLPRGELLLKSSSERHLDGFPPLLLVTKLGVDLRRYRPASTRYQAGGGDVDSKSDRVGICFCPVRPGEFFQAPRIKKARESFKAKNNEVVPNRYKERSEPAAEGKEGVEEAAPNEDVDASTKPIEGEKGGKGSDPRFAAAGRG